jgi:hypothetical protein
MQGSELNEFFAAAFDAFPGLRAFLAESPNTIRVWARTLENIALDEATSVLARWIDCRLPDPPVGYRRETFAIDVRAVVLNDRSVAARRNNQDKPDRKYVPSAAFRSVAEPFLKMLSLRAQVMAGELELEDCEKQIREIVEAF